MTPEELNTEFGQSEQGNFSPLNDITLPHPYCIGAAHVVHAGEHYHGQLTAECIKDLEGSRSRCCMKYCNLLYHEHEKALLVSCKQPLKIADKINPELHTWLLKIKSQAEAKGYAGFAFKEM